MPIPNEFPSTARSEPALDEPTSLPLYTASPRFATPFRARAVVGTRRCRHGQGGLAALLFLAILGTIAYIVASRTVEVTTGSRATCRQCGKEFENSIRTITVPWWEADKYRSESRTGYCRPCGEELVPFQVKHVCVRCQQPTAERTEHAPRKSEPRNKTVPDGFCSEKCEKIAKVEKGVDRASEAVGDIGGRIGRGFLEGMRKHF